MSDTSNDEEPHYTSPPSPVVRNLKCVDAESYKTAEALLDDLLELAKERDEIRKQRDAAMALIETIVHNVDVLSTRPAAAIKLNDLVACINEWGDAARKILKESSETT